MIRKASGSVSLLTTTLAKKLRPRITKALKALNDNYKDGLREPVDPEYPDVKKLMEPDGFLQVNDHRLGYELDKLRTDVIRLTNKLLVVAKIDPVESPLLDTPD